jgi:hypothetical protein
MRVYPRGEREAFVSLPDETVIFMTDLPGTAVKGVRSVDSFVAVEKPYRDFSIFYEDGHAIYHYGLPGWERSDKAAGQDLNGGWLNLEDSLGYVTVALSRDSTKMVLPKPGARGPLGLYHVADPRESQRFITVAFPNQSHAQTKAMSREVKGDYADGMMTCRVAGYLVEANFSGNEASKNAATEAGATIPPNSVRITRKGGLPLNEQ